MDAAAHTGIVFAVGEVYRELEKKDDDAIQWLKARRDMVIALDTEIQRVRKVKGCSRARNFRGEGAIPSG
jgi:hypothetical protein